MPRADTLTSQCGPVLRGAQHREDRRLRSQIARGIGELFGAKMSTSGSMKRANQPKTTSGGFNAMAIQKTALMRQPVAGYGVFVLLR